MTCPLSLKKEKDTNDDSGYREEYKQQYTYIKHIKQTFYMRKRQAINYKAVLAIHYEWGT